MRPCHSAGHASTCPLGATLSWSPTWQTWPGPHLLGVGGLLRGAPPKKNSQNANVPPKNFCSQTLGSPSSPEARGWSHSTGTWAGGMGHRGWCPGPWELGGEGRAQRGGGVLRGWMAGMVTCGEEVGTLGRDLVGVPRASSHWDHGGGIPRVSGALRQGVGPCGHSRAGQVPPPRTCWRQAAGAAGVHGQAGLVTHSEAGEAGWQPVPGCYLCRALSEDTQSSTGQPTL